MRDMGSVLGLAKSPQEGMATHSVFLHGKFHGEEPGYSYSPWGYTESRHKGDVK